MLNYSHASCDVTEKWASLVDLLLARSRDQPSQRAYTFITRGNTEVAQLTYQELDQQVRAIAANLQALGVAGQTALLVYPPGLDFIAGFFGCLYASVIAVPAYPLRRNQKSTRLQAIVKDCQATVALTTKTLQDSMAHQIAQAPELAKMHWFCECMLFLRSHPSKNPLCLNFEMIEIDIQLHPRYVASSLQENETYSTSRNILEPK